MVHAGISPQWTLKKAQKRAQEVEALLQSDRIAEVLENMYGNLPKRWNKKLEKADRYRYIINAFTRMRYCRKDKTLELICNQAPERAPEGLIPWFRHPKRKCREEPLIFGHWSTLGYRVESNVVSLDTGCVWGGRLTAIEIGKRSRTPLCSYQLSCEGTLEPESEEVIASNMETRLSDSDA
ncbi:unnamed protein product [Cyprideis torosa]|uniref:Uncharacterized protein n=1 Tax=Cyprideis torosa TaxID=163714 RepID=A0A7R8WT33_9CRUS|nr:unnamed protein product [Cyprideis torosa]CAG0908140.1 unnamed protein product [Cyprideis torosa]